MIRHYQEITLTLKREDRKEIIMQKEITKEIVAHLAVLSEKANGWKTELTKVSWNGKEPVFDLRSWSPDYETCSKGITLNDAEFAELARYIEHMGD